MYRDIQMIRAIMYLAMVLVIGVACFNIVSTLVMAVKDKSGDIAVLRTLGAKDGLIRAVFVWYGLLAGLLGSLCGVVIGGGFTTVNADYQCDRENYRSSVLVGRYLLYRLPAVGTSSAGCGVRSGDGVGIKPAGELVSGAPGEQY